MERLGQAVGRQCKPGSIVITTDYMLPLVNTIPPIDGDYRTGTYRLELAEKVDGWCWLTGGDIDCVHSSCCRITRRCLKRQQGLLPLNIEKTNTLV